MKFNNSFKDHFDNYFNKLSSNFNSEILASIEKLAEDLTKIWNLIIGVYLYGMVECG